MSWLELYIITFADQIKAVIEVYQATFLMQLPVYKGEWAKLEGERK